MIKLLSYYLLQGLSIVLILIMTQISLSTRILLLSVYCILIISIKSRFFYAKDRKLFSTSFCLIVLILTSYYSLSVFYSLILIIVSAGSFFEKVIIDKNLLSKLEQVNEYIELSIFSLSIDSKKNDDLKFFPLQSREYAYLRDLLIYKYPQSNYSNKFSTGDIKYEIFTLKVFELASKN